MQNKEQVFQNLLSENKDRLYRLCKGFIGHSGEVDDLFQEIMINVWNNIEKFRGEAKMSTWLYRIATNTALLYRKRSNKRSQVLQTGLANSASQQYASENQLQQKIEQENQLNQLLKAINQLEKQDRIIITLVLEGFSYQEIAEVVGISVNYIGVKINRIKNKLSKKVKTHG